MEPLSVSQVQAYLACPLKYRFQYVDKIEKPWRAAALAFGTSIHAGVEYFHRERLAGRTPELVSVLGVFDADWYAANLEPLVFSRTDSQESLAEKGRELVRLYVEGVNGELPRAIESPFETDLVDPETGEDLDVRLRGYVDLVEADGTVVDLKTAARTVGPGDLERHLQLSVYALGAFLRQGAIPKLRLDVLLKTRVPRFERHETSRTLADLSWTAQLVRTVAQAIRSRSFHPNPSWRCSECEFFAHCQVWRGE
jgi:putative RecB family exonuclease